MIGELINTLIEPMIALAILSAITVLIFWIAGLIQGYHFYRDEIEPLRRKIREAREALEKERHE